MTLEGVKTGGLKGGGRDDRWSVDGGEKKKGGVTRWERGEVE